MVKDSSKLESQLKVYIKIFGNDLKNEREWNMNGNAFQFKGN
jgi:hypothetical protein